MKTMVAAGMAGLMMATAGLPGGTAQAGQREWATAGKILTGVVIGGAVLNSCTPRATHTRIVYERPVYRPQPTYYFSDPPRCERPVMRSCPPPRFEPAPECREPIIRYMADGRRLYQPPMHGHPAFIQVWSEVKDEWVSVKEHPSIW